MNVSLGGLLLTIGIGVVSSQHPTTSSLSDLPYDENGRLSTHLIVYPAGECAGLLEKRIKKTYGYKFRPLSDEAASSFFDEEEDDGGGGRECQVACVERGVDRSLVTAVMPFRYFRGTEDEFGSAALMDWFRNACTKVEVCFMNYYSRTAPLDFYWHNHMTDALISKGVLEYGERKTRCIDSFVGHEFVFKDSDTQEEIQRHKVEYNTIISIGGVPDPYVVDKNFNYTQGVESTLRTEWSKHNRIKHTFTSLGFSKGRLPDDMFASIGAFYYNNAHNRVREEWQGKGYYVNWWETDVFFVQVPWRLKSSWQNRLKDLVEAWSGHELEQTDMYGLRRYEENARLLTHVDRVNTHAASLIINVAQGNVEEPWPVEIFDHADRLHEVTMEPGDIIYYESASCLHSRSKPLKGSSAYYVNLFTHYRPVGDPHWYEKPNLEGTPEPLMDVGECRLEGTIDQVGMGAVKCDNSGIGPYLSPTLFKATSGDDLFEWWKRVGPDIAEDSDNAGTVAADCRNDGNCHVEDANEL